MSEYVTIEVEFSDDPTVAELYINQDLTEADGRGLRQPARRRPGLAHRPIALLGRRWHPKADDNATPDHTITRAPGQPWEAIIDEVRDALRDWFL